MQEKLNKIIEIIDKEIVPNGKHSGKMCLSRVELGEFTGMKISGLLLIKSAEKI